MKTKIEIPKDLLAQIDFQNTLNGGIAQNTARAWRDNDGYRMILDARGIDIEDIHIQTGNQRFTVFHMINVLEGEEQMPHYLVNLPLSPEVDVKKISAHSDEFGRIHIKAPFNDWAKGNVNNIQIER